MRARRVSCVAVAAVFYLTPAPSFGVVGRYLPDLPVDWGDTQTTAYGTVHQFDRDVVDIPKNINAGQIKFDYAKTFEQDKPPGTTKYGGAALIGGFFAGNGITVKPGYQLAWVQMVTSTNTGGSAMTDWGLPATGAGGYPDAGPADPRYGGNNPGGDFAPGTATLGFTDFPRRDFTANPQDWQAELGLVCIANNAAPNGFREVRVISSFFWGFSLNPQAPLDINDVTEAAPTLYGIPTNNFVNTLNSFYDGQGPPPSNVASSKYLFSSNSNCFIPEPGTLCLLMLGGLWASRRRAAA